MPARSPARSAFKIRSIKPSSLEVRFARLWDLCGGPPLEAEYHFHPSRKWRADFAHLGSRTLIELEGGAFSGGRHTRGAGFIADCEKYLAAALLGWTVLRLSAPQITPATVREVANFIEGKALDIKAGNRTGKSGRGELADLQAWTQPADPPPAWLVNSPIVCTPSFPKGTIFARSAAAGCSADSGSITTAPGG